MFSAVQVSLGEDLVLDLSVPEPVEVIYKSSDLADGEQICNVTKDTPECNAEYTPRTSLSHRNLTIRGVAKSESGSYIIRDTTNKEDICVYSVSVIGMSPHQTQENHMLSSSVCVWRNTITLLCREYSMHF